MTTELLHEGISLSDLLHRPSDSESKDIRAKTGAFAVSGSTLARGKGPLTTPPICGSHWLAAEKCQHH